MNTHPRTPGRPRGSSRYKDGPHLDAVADLLVSEPKLRKTPAIGRIVRKRHPERSHDWSSIERRLLRKWNREAEERLAAARERHEERRPRPQRPAPYHDPAFFSSVFIAEAARSAESISQLVDPLMIGGIAAQAAKMDAIIGVAAAAQRHWESSGVQEAVRRAQEDHERTKHLFAHFDRWRLAGF